MKLTNLNFIHFCQGLLGAPYWYNAAGIKATKNAYKVNAMRFPEMYEKNPAEYYIQHIEDNEIVTDTIGLIKSFAWNDGGEEVLKARGTNLIPNAHYCSNNCPDKTPNGLFSWASIQNSNWGAINTMPEIPGLIVSMNNELAIYEGNGVIIRADEIKGVIREPLREKNWKFWYELPFIDYNEEIKAKEEPEIKEEFVLQLTGLAIATNNVLFRDAPNENAKLLDIIIPDSKLEVYNDSNERWLHVIYDGQEGYTIPEYFIYYPKIPNIISSDNPKEMNKELQGDHILLANIGIKNKAHIRSQNYVVLPKGSIVSATGGYTDNWIQVYAEHNKRSYVGYVDKKYLKKVNEL